MKLSKDLAEFIQLLNKHNVEYLLVGGWAVSLHVKPRYTKDIDFLVNRTGDNAKKILAALDEFGFGSLNFSETDLLNPAMVIQLGNEPNRIDILTSLDAVDFPKAYLNRIELPYEDFTISIINASDLIANKESVGRDQDLVDAKMLRKMVEKG